VTSPYSVVRLETDHSAVPIRPYVSRRAQRRSRRAAGPRTAVRLVLDGSEHADTLSQIPGCQNQHPALDRQHGIYRDRHHESRKGPRRTATTCDQALQAVFEARCAEKFLSSPTGRTPLRRYASNCASCVGSNAGTALIFKDDGLGKKYVGTELQRYLRTL
jgi:hypothetical protein